MGRSGGSLQGLLRVFVGEKSERSGGVALGVALGLERLDGVAPRPHSEGLLDHLPQ